MVIGNPYKFAFIIDIVPEWNGDDTYTQGIFFMCIEGKLFPPVLDTTTLSSDISYILRGSPYSSPALFSLPVNIILFNKEKKQSFIDMFNLTYPGCLNPEIDLDDLSITNDYTYKASNPTMEDNNNHVFIVSDGDSVRILGAQVDAIHDEGYDAYFVSDIVHESILSKDEMTGLILELKNFYRKFIYPK